MLAKKMKMSLDGFPFSVWGSYLLSGKVSAPCHSHRPLELPPGYHLPSGRGKPRMSVKAKTQVLENRQGLGVGARAKGREEPQTVRDGGQTSDDPGYVPEASLRSP